MGKRGPKPQPAELKALRGNPGKRALPKVPVSDPMMPDIPKDMPARIASMWSHYGGVLVRIGILREADGVAWELLWRTFKNYLDAVQIGDIALQLRTVKAILPLLDRFGMNPTSRSSLSIEPPKGEDEFTKFRARLGKAAGA